MASNAIRWYAKGIPMPPNSVLDPLNNRVISNLKVKELNLSPSTYEEAMAYLEDELKKPEGSRDLLREMCLVMPLRVPDNEDTVFVFPRSNLVEHISKGELVIYRTLDVPVDSFTGDEEDGGPHVKDLKTGKLLDAEATILLSYFTRIGPVLDSPLVPPSAISWYINGTLLPRSNMLVDLDDYVIDTLKKQNLDFSPTTYEKAKAYLDEELKKPEGSRDLLREMCAILPMKIPEGESAVLVLPRLQVIVPFDPGHIIVYPTVDVPSDSFSGSEEADVPYLMNSKTKNPLSPGAEVMLTYFTRIGPEKKDTGAGRAKDVIKLDYSPFS